MYISTTSNGYSDVIELRDYVKAADYVVNSATKKMTLTNNPALKRRLTLKIELTP